MKKTSSYLLLGILIMSLTACVEYREEIWLNKDDSGWLSFEIGLSLHTGIEEDEISKLSIVSQCDSVEGMSVIATATREEDGVTWIRADVEFDHILLLNEVKNKWFGFISLDTLEKFERRFNRIISMSDTIKTNGNKYARVLKFAVFGQYPWVYTTHFPDDVIGSNAPFIYTDTLSNTVTWEYNLASLINDEKKMSVHYRHGPVNPDKKILKRKQ